MGPRTTKSEIAKIEKKTDRTEIYLKLLTFLEQNRLKIGINHIDWSLSHRKKYIQPTKNSPKAINN